MSNVEIEDIHYQDLTTTSDWEVFIAGLEERIRDWKLPQTKSNLPLKEKDFINLTWEENSEKLTFSNVFFTLKHFKLKVEEDPSQTSNYTASDDQEDTFTQCQKDLLCSENDFVKVDKTYLEVSYYYGVREFLLLVPESSSIIEETKMKILLSSLTIALSNTNCEIPAFVQVQEPWQKFYLGVSVGLGSRVHFDMVHLKKIPIHCKHLTGLLTLFKQKISEGCGVRLNLVEISIRLSYTLKDWTSSTWAQEPPDFDFLQGETLGVDEFGKLPFGANFDPIKEFYLFVSWSKLSEGSFLDSEIHSDLDPLNSNDWSLQVEMIPTPACLLGEYLSHFLQLSNSRKSLGELLGDGAVYTDNEGQSLSSAFNALTESKIPSISTVINRRTSKARKNLDGPITEDLLIPILYFLFPDAEEVPRAPYSENNGCNVEDDQWRGIKTCSIDGLVWRLAIVAAHCANNLGNLNALAQLWHEFVQEIRFRWEKCIPLPGVAPGFPDCVRTCILHQKLQMINCCIARKKAREECERKELGTSGGNFMDVDPGESSDNSDEDEFFECTNEEATAPAKLQMMLNRPVGRLAKHPTLLLVKTGEPLYLPVTQDPVPKTEDQLEEDAQVMMELGTDKNASEMRARLMSASLLSDMESFKAANPSGILEDFIRWYSPRDWIEEDGLDEWGQKAGHLSPRMLIDNNPWSSTWKSAQPVAAHRQKRLFDDTREAEKVLHYLASRQIGQVGQLLLPVLAHAALVTLHDQKVPALPNLAEVVQAISNRMQFATKPIHQKPQIYEEIIRDMEHLETLIAQVNSLQLKLSTGNKDSSDEELTSFIIQLMRGKEVPVPGGSIGPLGKRIKEVFAEAQNGAHSVTGSRSVDLSSPFDGKKSDEASFPPPTSKEFILRAKVPRPAPTSTVYPQRLYVNIDRDGIRMAGAFSEDTVFI